MTNQEILKAATLRLLLQFSEAWPDTTTVPLCVLIMLHTHFKMNLKSKL